MYPVQLWKKSIPHFLQCRLKNCKVTYTVTGSQTALEGCESVCAADLELWAHFLEVTGQKAISELDCEKVKGLQFVCCKTLLGPDLPACLNSCEVSVSAVPMEYILEPAIRADTFVIGCC